MVGLINAAFAIETLSRWYANKTGGPAERMAKGIWDTLRPELKRFDPTIASIVKMGWSVTTFGVEETNFEMWRALPQPVLQLYPMIGFFIAILHNHRGIQRNA